MKSSNLSNSSLAAFGGIKRRSVSVGNGNFIEAKPLFSERSLPLTIQPRIEGVNLIDWTAKNLELIRSYLQQYAGILFRNFEIRHADRFEEFIATVSGELLEYRDRSSPRSPVAGNIYTSTDYPANQTIFLHSENSYAANWPLKIFFCCLKPATAGGETPIADTRKLLQRIPTKIRDRFAEKQVMYVRNFGDGFGLPWQTVFQTENPEKVEEFCRQNGIEWEWKGENRLRTRQVRQAIRQHPYTCETVWFNHAAFFHVSTLESTIREALLRSFSEADLPHNTYYGDGSAIEPEVLEIIRAAYREETVKFAWQAGDILMLDNMLAAHGRQPFSGERKVVVGMSEPFMG